MNFVKEATNKVDMGTFGEQPYCVSYMRSEEKWDMMRKRYNVRIGDEHFSYWGSNYDWENKINVNPLDPFSCLILDYCTAVNCPTFKSYIEEFGIELECGNPYWVKDYGSEQDLEHLRIFEALRNSFKKLSRLGLTEEIAYAISEELSNMGY